MWLILALMQDVCHHKPWLTTGLPVAQWFACEQSPKWGKQCEKKRAKRFQFLIFFALFSPLQWLEHMIDVQKVKGLIPITDSDFFLCHKLMTF